MNIDVATLQLLILAAPGVLWASLEQSVESRRKFQQFIFTVKILAYGVISFAVLGLIYAWLSIPFDVLDFQNQASFKDRIDEVLWALPVAFFLACVSIANRAHSWSVSFFRGANLTNYSGTEDIWEFSLARAGFAGEYVYVRDFENGLVYSGLVKAYSDESDQRELLLEDVSVYDLNSNPMYELDRIYLSCPKNSARIEFPKVEEGDSDGAEA